MKRSDGGMHCVYSTPSGREDRGVGPVHHEDSENSEGPWQQSSLHGLVQGQETDCQLFTGVEICRRLEPIPRLTPRFPRSYCRQAGALL